MHYTPLQVCCAVSVLPFCVLRELVPQSALFIVDKTLRGKQNANASDSKYLNTERYKIIRLTIELL
jgi:hypothetical protein